MTISNNNNKYANEVLDDIECYKLVLSGKIKRFPNGFWDKPWSLKSAAIITRYVLENKYKLDTREKIIEKYQGNLIKDSKLVGMLSQVFKGNIFEVLDNAYPNEFKPWELKYPPQGFWKKDENIIQVVKWIVETKLDNNRERVCKEFGSDLLSKIGIHELNKIGIYIIA